MVFPSVTTGLAAALMATLALGQPAPGGRFVGPGAWYVRVTNPRGAGHRLCARIYFNPNLDPWYGATLYVANGPEARETPPEARWLAPGQSSEWVDIGAHMSRRPTFSAPTEYLAPVFVGALTSPKSSGLRLRVELARGPQRTRVRTIDVADPRPTQLGCSTWLSGPRLPTLGLLVPTSPGSRERVWTLEEAAARQLKWIRTCGPTPAPSRHIWFISHQSSVQLTNPTRLEALQADIVRGLGYANLVNYAGSAAEAAALAAIPGGMAPTRIVHAGGDLAAEADRLRKAGLWETVRLVNIGDEIDIEGSLHATPAEQDAAFAADLRERGLDAMDYVRPADEAAARALPDADRWRHVHLAGPLPANKPRLLYEAATFRYRLWTRELAAVTREAKRVFPPGVQTGANYSPHLSVWPDVRKWVNLFRDGGMTMPWSEDWWWQVPEASPQSYGFLLDALRLASDYHGNPSCFYTIPDNGETPEHLLRMNYFALAHQAKVIDHFAIYHQAFGTCDYIDFLESKAKFRAIHRILGDVGQIDERLAAARMRPAEVAIAMPVASDVWDNEDLLTSSDQSHVNNLYYAHQNVNSHERKAIWLALRHAGIPVDLITDDDIARGRLARYRVLYLVGAEMVAAAAPRLREWVEGGGTLVGSGGGGLADEYRQPLPAMQALYGIEAASLTRPVRSIGPASDLPEMRALDTITMAGAGLRAPQFCVRHTLKPAAGARVVASASDASAAGVENRVGSGRAILYGFLPGLAYLQPAVARHRVPAAYPEPLRALITRPAVDAGVRCPVTTTDPLVEATLQEGPHGAVITLVSFRDAPRTRVTVALPGLPGTQSVRSVRRGALRVRHAAGVPTVTLDVDQGDFLLPEP